MTGAVAMACCARVDASGKDVYESARRSLVVVQYNWDFELGRREIFTPGVVVSEDGLVMCTGATFDERVAEKQIKDVKIIVPRPGQEPLEIDAEYQGRDDRTRVAFVKARQKQSFKPIRLSKTMSEVGDAFYSIGLLGKISGYRPHLTQGMVAAVLPGERTQVLVDGSLTGVGSVVLNAEGMMIGFVDNQPATAISRPGQAAPVQSSPATFTPAVDLADSVEQPPTPQRRTPMPWFGVSEMNGLKQTELTYFGLTGPTAQVAAVSPASPAETAGLKPGDLIVKLNDQPLEAGDTTDQIPLLFQRRLFRAKPGENLVVTVISGKGGSPRDVTVTLSAAPPRPSQMDRFWASDLGFGVREMAYVDRYAQRLRPDATGVIVSVVKVDAPAGTAKIVANMLVLNINGHPIIDLADFTKAYIGLREARPQEAVVLLVRRDGHDETVRIEPNR